MENLSPKAQAGLLIGLLAVFYLVGYLVFIKDWYSTTKLYQKQIEKLESEIKEAKKLTKNIEQFRAKKKDLKRQLEILKEILPSKEEAGQLYSKLNKMAQESGVDIVEIKAGQKKPRGITFELPYKIKMRARYHDIGYFFAKLANFEKIIEPSNPRPIFILGGKGSGKTHILRYFSYESQKIRAEINKISLLSQLQKEGYISVPIIR